ncbi:MAG: D-aminoacyl-tRNA deacylase [Bacillota bacterium]|nr:D-aminoacyl-tRNA deacylase [Bacillota bacterium]
MRALIQRVTRSSVTVEDRVVGKIDRGFTVLLGVEDADDDFDVEYIAKKIAALRVFEDEEGKMNRALSEVGGSVLLISQFTLYADTRKGNRPSFVGAGKPEHANRLYQEVAKRLNEKGIAVETGVFAAHMTVQITNDGPVTIWIDSAEMRKTTTKPVE